MDIIPIIISSFSLLVAALGVLYLKREVDILKRNSEKRKNFEKTSNAIFQVRKIIKNTSKPTSFKSLNTIQDDIAKDMKDNPKLVGWTLEITPEPFRLDIAYTNLAYKNVDDLRKPFTRVPIASSQHLIDALVECAESEFSTVLTKENVFRFKANPDILQNNSINLYALLDEIVEYYRAYKVLKEHELIIGFYDDTVIETIKNSIDQMVNSIFVSISEKHVLNFDSRHTYSDILRRLTKGIIDLDSIADMRNSLITLCDTKLVSVQHKLSDVAYR